MGIDIKSRSNNEMDNSMLTTHFDSGVVDDEMNYRGNLASDTPDREAKALSPKKNGAKSSTSNNSISVGK